jgi:two-component system, NarL family, nitrate/nitrite response regulator NarL
MTTVLIVCDVRIYREGLADVLGRADQVYVVGAARDAPEAVGWAERASPEVVLIDMAMPRSLEVVGAITVTAHDTRIVALSMPETEREVIACAEAGITGYVSREASIEDLLDAVTAAARGEVVCSPRVAASLVREVARRWEPAPGSLPESGRSSTSSTGAYRTRRSPVRSTSLFPP